MKKTNTRNSKLETRHFRYGWIPDLPDRRDFAFQPSMGILAAMPPRTDLRQFCSPVYDQKDIGSCTAQAIAAAHWFAQLKQLTGQRSIFDPARLFIYYNERVIEGSEGYDSGATLRDGMKTIARQGVCDELIWPYDTARFAKKPPVACYTAALKHQGLVYRRLKQDLTDLRSCLAAGFPFVFGFTVYESFESKEVARTGIAPAPKPRERALGGHAVLAVGYDDATKRFLVRNSWGMAWGMKGYFTISYEYVTNDNLACDFWVLSKVE